jgi:GT2 family glycosyltransferase
MSLAVGICITTHNRCADLTRTLAALSRLAPAPDEVIVTADGCTDGTLDLLRRAHPGVRMVVHETVRGSIPSRNEMAALCTCDVFVSLDDDSYPLDGDFVARVRQLFTTEPRLAVASFPQRTDEFPETLTAPGFGPAEFVGSFANSGAAIRRPVFRELGGYPDFFFHAYEEPDFALRCVAAGWQVRHETSLAIRHHFTGAQRNEVRTHQRHARNELWSVLLRCPAPQLFGVALFRAARQLCYAWSRGPGWALREPRWWLEALAGVPRCLAARRPLPWSRYLAWMRLVRTPIRDAAEWTAIFGGKVA